MTPRKKALEEFDRFCRFLDGINMNGFVENDFMSKPVQKLIRAALTPVAGDVADAVRYALAEINCFQEILKDPQKIAGDSCRIGVKYLETLISAATQAESLRATVSEYQTRLETQAERILELEKVHKWQDISTIPQYSYLAVLVANKRGSMEPVHVKFGKMVNCYANIEITWKPTHWQALPAPPSSAKGEE